MNCDLCHKVTKFPYIIRRKEEDVINSKLQLCLNCFEKTPPSSFIPDEEEKNTNEQKEIECDLCAKHILDNVI